MIKVHLINDEKRNCHRPKLGLGYLSSYLKKYLKDVRISISFKGDNLEKNITDFSPHIIGITSTTETFDEMSSLATAIKRRFDIPIVMGGHHITLFPDKLPESIDAGVLGEGEQTFIELIEHFSKTGNIGSESIDGLVFRKNGKLIKTSDRTLIEPLDNIPPPDLDLLEIDEMGPGHILTSRGCPYKCVFCASSSFWKYTRFYSPERVVSEIRNVVNKYKRNFILIYDDLFTADINRVKKISELICEEGLNKQVTFECLANVNFFDSEVADALRRMNVLRISFGMESGSPKVLDYLKGGKVTHEKIQNAVKLAIDKGFEVLGSFMIGVPFENQDDLMQTYNFIKKTRLTEIGVNVATPYPGTKLWDDAVTAGYIENGEWNQNLYAMKTVTPLTIEKKNIISPVDKDVFLAVYKMIIDWDSSLIDRRMRLQNLRQRAVSHLSNIEEGTKKLLDMNSEDGTLAAGIRSDVSNVEITGLNPEQDYLFDAKRRIDIVPEENHKDFLFSCPENHFDCVILNDSIGKLENPKKYIQDIYPIIKDNGKIIMTLPNKLHFAQMVNLLFNLKRPPFETVDGTVQYETWGNPDKNVYSRITLDELLQMLKEVNLHVLEVTATYGRGHKIFNYLSALVSKNDGDVTQFVRRSSPLRYFVVAGKDNGDVENRIEA